MFWTLTTGEVGSEEKFHRAPNRLPNCGMRVNMILWAEYYILTH